MKLTGNIAKDTMLHGGKRIASHCLNCDENTDPFTEYDRLVKAVSKKYHTNDTWLEIALDEALQWLEQWCADYGGF